MVDTKLGIWLQEPLSPQKTSPPIHHVHPVKSIINGKTN
jgi:hypothetical protein